MTTNNDFYTTDVKTLNMATRLWALSQWEGAPTIGHLKEEYPNLGKYNWSAGFSYAIKQKFITTKRVGFYNELTLTALGKKFIKDNKNKIQDIYTVKIILQKPTLKDEEQPDMFPDDEDKIHKDDYTEQTKKTLKRLEKVINAMPATKLNKIMKRIDQLISEEEIK